MSTVKISDLPVISTLNLDTTQTIIPVVDISTDETGQVTVKTLADGMFHNDSLKVGPNEILLANTIAQFSGNSETFLQTNLQNLNANGSADYVATADIGTNANNFIDVGLNNSNYDDPDYSAMKSLDGYLYTYGSLDDSADGNLVIGTASAGANILFIAGGTTEANVVAKITKFGITLNNASRLEFTDGSIQTVAAAPASSTQGAFNTANSASANTVIIQGVDVWQNTQITAVNQYAQSGYAIANAVNGYATSAFATANGANGLAAGAFNTANGANGLASGAFNKANNAIANTFSITVNNSVYIPGSLVVDGLVFANGATYVANTMSIPTTYTSPQTAITLNYQQANIVKTNVTADLVVSHTGIVLGKYIDLFVYNDSAAVRTITHGVPANNSTTKASTVKVSPYSTKHLKYFTVDSDLANTYVIESVNENLIEGNLNVTGNIVAAGISTSNLVSFISSTTPSGNALVELIGSTSGLQQAPSQDGYMLHVTGKDDIPTRIIYDAFGANSYPIIAGRRGRGVAGAPTAVANNDVLFRISGNGWGTTQFAPLGSGRIDIVAAENYTDSARGSRIDFFNVPNGSNTINKIASFNANSVEFTGVVSPEKGFIYVPTILVGAQTAFTIDFSATSLIKATLAADCTITLSNYLAGKVVEVWLTNTSGLTRTITHGCTATNSSENATTFTMPGTSSAYLRYFSIDGDNANTFVAIQHA